jgi:hypothetical protein
VPFPADLARAESAYVRAWRLRRGCGEDQAASDTLVGLALSGGGIRSATFALGAMQALAGRCLLEKFDYLSTVSGGGYMAQQERSCHQVPYQRSLMISPMGL